MAVYTPLKAEHIRLLHLQLDSNNPLESVYCSLQLYGLNDDSNLLAHTALANTWAEPRPDLPPDDVSVIVNRERIAVGSKLSTALQNFATRKMEWVWADAICINRHDNQDRSQQVTLMRRIYQRAGKVVAWLGRDDSTETDALVDFLSSLLTKGLSNFPLHGVEADHVDSCLQELERSQAYDLVLIALRRLLDANYWEQAWILQEIAFGKEVEL